jgi:hypothetical protein
MPEQRRHVSFVGDVLIACIACQFCRCVRIHNECEVRQIPTANTHQLSLLTVHVPPEEMEHHQRQQDHDRQDRAGARLHRLQAGAGLRARGPLPQREPPRSVRRTTARMQPHDTPAPAHKTARHAALPSAPGFSRGKEDRRWMRTRIAGGGNMPEAAAGAGAVPKQPRHSSSGWIDSAQLQPSTAMLRIRCSCLGCSMAAASSGDPQLRAALTPCMRC